MYMFAEEQRNRLFVYNFMFGRMRRNTYLLYILPASPNTSVNFFRR